MIPAFTWNAGRDEGTGTAIALVGTLVPATAVYGAVIGMWTGPRLAFYAAVKLPLVLLATAALTLLLAWIGAMGLGCPMRLGRVALSTLRSLTIAAVCLASLAPVAWLFTLCAPPPTTGARTAHNLLYLMHTGFVAISGLAGTLSLLRELRSLGATSGVALRVYAFWLLAFAAVGGEVAWALRPFVGSVYMPVVFLRDDALRGNVYEFILTDIAPHLAGRLESNDHEH